MKRFVIICELDFFSVIWLKFVRQISLRVAPPPTNGTARVCERRWMIVERLIAHMVLALERCLATKWAHCTGSTFGDSKWDPSSMSEVNIVGEKLDSHHACVKKQKHKIESFSILHKLNKFIIVITPIVWHIFPWRISRIFLSVFPLNASRIFHLER